MSENEQVILEMLEKMQQQLSFLEKKIDALSQNAQQRPSFNRDRGGFGRPFRPFGNRPGRPEGGQGFGHRQDRQDRHDRPSHGGHRPGGRPDGGFAPKKKSFFGPRGR